MSQYQAIKAATNAYIKTNGRQEITGAILNAVMIATIDSLGRFYQFVGVATPDTDPGTIDQNIAYLASTPGTYTHLGGITIDAGELSVIKFDGVWKKEVIAVIPTKVSQLVNDLGFITNAVSDLVNYYTKAETFSKAEVTSILSGYYDKDEVDSIVSALTGQSYVVAWDGTAEPVVGDIPAGVSVTWGGNPYVGTLPASASTAGKIYLVSNGAGYDEYITTEDGGYSWVGIGTTSIDLSGYATKAELTQLEHEVTDLYFHPGYIDTSTETLPTIRKTSTIYSALSPCLPGQKFIITGTGGNSKYYRLYAWYDVNGDQLDRYSGSGAVSGLEVTAPAGAVSAVFNFYNYNSATDKVERLGTHTLYDYEKLRDIVDDNSAIIKKKRVFTESNLSDGYVFVPDGLIGDTISYNANTSWKSILVPVKKGDRITAYTKGGTNARAWILTDGYYRSIDRAEQGLNFTLTPYTHTALYDGFLAINCEAANASLFSLEIYRNIDSVAESNENKIQSLPLAPRFHNAVFPYGKGDIRILSIGNSYAANSTAYLSELIAAAGLDDTKISHYILTSSAATLQYWAESTGTYTAVRVGGSRTMQNTGTLDQILAQDWDIVTIQQYSGDAIDYATYVPYLTQLVARIRAKCTNQKVCIMFNQAWAYWEDFTAYLKGDDRWKAITDAVTEMAARDGVDIIIPTGTAIQNARHTSLNTAHDLSIDGTHLAPGTGKYIAACCWFQMLYSPVFNVSMLGNTATHEVQPSEYDSSSYEYEDVTDANRGLCQECAFYAAMDYKTIWDIEE